MMRVLYIAATFLSAATTANAMATNSLSFDKKDNMVAPDGKVVKVDLDRPGTARVV